MIFYTMYIFIYHPIDYFDYFYKILVFSLRVRKIVKIHSAFLHFILLCLLNYPSTIPCISLNFYIKNSLSGKYFESIINVFFDYISLNKNALGVSLYYTRYNKKRGAKHTKHNRDFCKIPYFTLFIPP